MELEIPDYVKNVFKRKQKETFILVTESDRGIETYLNPLIKQFNGAYKEQLKSFLTGVIKELGGK